MHVSQGDKHLILLGPPGAGKGTQSQKLAQNLGMTILSTGEILRAAKDSPEIKSIMEQGKLVDDVTIVNLVKKEMLNRKANFIFDGFPRTIGQAKILDSMLAENNHTLVAAIAIFVEKEELIERITGRLQCVDCKHIMHKNFLPNYKKGDSIAEVLKNNVCSNCQGKLSVRSDDDPEAFKIRLEAYYRDTYPLIDYYKQKNIYYEIDGNLSVSEVEKSLSKAAKKSFTLNKSD